MVFANPSIWFLLKKYLHESFKKNEYLEQGSNLSESSVYVDFALRVHRPVALFLTWFNFYPSMGN